MTMSLAGHEAGAAGWAVAALFLAWFGLSAAWQFRSVREHHAVPTVFGAFRLLPIFTFFAPIPGMADYHIIYRDRDGAGGVSGWREAPVVRRRRFFDFVWNPRKRLHKLVADSVNEIKQVRNSLNRDDADETLVSAQLRLTDGYLSLHNFVAGAPPAIEDAQARQFMFAEALHITGTRQVAPVFRSPFHKLS